jgi:hypothetical protein
MPTLTSGWKRCDVKIRIPLPGEVYVLLEDDRMFDKEIYVRDADGEYEVNEKAKNVRLFARTTLTVLSFATPVEPVCADQCVYVMMVLANGRVGWMELYDYELAENNLLFRIA